MRRDHLDLTTCVVCGGAFFMDRPVDAKARSRRTALLCHECRVWSLDTEVPIIPTTKMLHPSGHSAG
jgi:hypothetical protein